MSYYLMVVLSYSIIPAAIAAGYKLKMGDASFRPILYCLILGLLNEICSTLVIENGGSNALNNSIYCLLEALLILTQFKRWGLFEKFEWIYSVLIIAILLGWTAENHNWQRLNTFLPFFRCGSGIMVLAMSIVQINKMIAGHEGSLLRNSCIIFCWGFCFSSSISILLEVFLYYETTASILLKDAVFKASITGNVVANIIYLIATIWIPGKPRSIT